jgi:DNA-binding NtrC family response regulator
MKIFLVDDERILRVSLADELRDAGHTVLEFAEASGVLQSLVKENPDMVITDIRMPGMDGLELLEKIRQITPSVSVVVMTAWASVDTAIRALKLGAYDYLSKPFRSEEVLHLISRVNELRSIRQDNLRLQSQVSNPYNFSSFTGESSSVRQMFDLIENIADTGASVLITGETGTGKELLANIIHYNSNRRNKAFIKVSCAILAREVFESELFGHVKGAFTGAEKERKGRFELADRGSLYLDDVDDIPYELQVKLLRVLQEQEIEPVGSSGTIKVDVRLICSTKYDLKQLVSEGRFRDDLYYRLNVIPVHIPPLRDRPEDVPLLLERFINEFNPARPVKFDPSVIAILQEYKWPGNVRELKNLAERLSLIFPGKVISPESLPAELLLPYEPDGITHSTWDLEKVLAKTEADLIKAALSRSGGNKTKAARLLHLPLSTFRTKSEKHGLDHA